jgi:hypothetical protein
MPIMNTIVVRACIAYGAQYSIAHHTGTDYVVHLEQADWTLGMNLETAKPFTVHGQNATSQIQSTRLLVS